MIINGGDNMAEFKDRLKTALSIRKMSAAELARKSNVNEGAISQYKKGAYKATQENLERLANTLNVSIAWLMGADVPMEKDIKYSSPIVADDVVTFPVLGSIAAGYDCIANENIDFYNDTVEIPQSYLCGRRRDEFMVLRISGDSMYPLYQNGDIVLILKQSTLDRSGDIGAVIYNDDCATIKKIEYAYGEDWMRLVPINPSYKPEMIRGEELEHCRVIGIPKLLIRKI